MMLPSTEFIPNTVLDQRADSLFREHERRSGSPITLPVPIEAIIEHTLELRVLCIPIEESPGEIILARIDPDYDGHATIQLNDNRIAHFEEFFGTEQFSFAHEVGHWVLHLDRGRSRQMGLQLTELGQVSEVVLCRRMSAGDRRELQAERFAAFLLLPEHLIRPHAQDYDLSRWSGIAAIAHDCGVSKRAMARRLDELGLVNLGPEGQLLRDDRNTSIRLI